jgi:hypothetical protein
LIRADGFAARSCGSNATFPLCLAPGTVRISSRVVTVHLMPAAGESECLALRAFLHDLTRMKLMLPGDPDSRRLRWMLK